MKLKWRRPVLATFAALLGGCGAWWAYDSQQSELGTARTEAFVRGDPDVHLESLVIEYQQRRVQCSDPDTLRYFEKCVREGEQWPPFRAGWGGVHYKVQLRFHGGGCMDAETFWLKDRFKFFMPYQETDCGEEERVKVEFKPPLPPAIAELLDFLDRPCDEVSGHVMVIESGGTSREYHGPSRIKRGRP